MTKLVLNSLANLQNETSAVNTINSNSTAISAALENTLSRDGTSPNQMGADFDMNSHRILNLPAPVSPNDVVRFQDLSTVIGGGTIAPVPTGGATNAFLMKNSGTTYDMVWSNTLTGNVVIPGTSTLTVNGNTISLAAGTATVTIPNSTDTLVGRGTTDTFTGVKTFNDGKLLLAGSSSGTTTLKASAAASGVITLPATTDTVVVLAAAQTLTNKTLTTPIISSISNTGTLTLPTSTDTLVGRATTDTLTNKTIDTAGPNTIKLNGNTLTAGAGTGTITAPSGTHTLAVLDANAFTAAQTITSNTNSQLSISPSSGDGASITISGSTTTMQIGQTASDVFFKSTTNTPIDFGTNNSTKLTLAASGGLFSVSAGGGDKGANTANFGAVYQNGNQINYPAFQAIRTSSQSFTSGTGTKVQFDTKIFDTNTYYDNTTNFRFTPLVAGKYFVSLCLQISATFAAGSFAQAFIAKNGSPVNGGFQSMNFPAGTFAPVLTGSAIVVMNGSTDFIEGWGNCNGTTPSFSGSVAPSNSCLVAYYLGA